MPSFFSGPLRRSAASTICFGLRAAPAVTIAVCPSRLIDTPAAGGVTLATAGSALTSASTLRVTRANAGSAAVREGEWSTIIRPVEALPAKCFWISERAATDCDPVASQPAPESAVSTRGARNPSPTARTTQAMATWRVCVAA